MFTCGIIFHDFLSADIFQHHCFQNILLQISDCRTAWMQNVGPGLGPNCLQTSAADDKFAASRQIVITVVYPMDND